MFSSNENKFLSLGKFDVNGVSFCGFKEHAIANRVFT